MKREGKKVYDLIVIGSGAGLNVASRAHAAGMNVAVLDDGPIGGTCLNRGCVPTKVLLYPAEVVSTVKNAKGVGVKVSGIKVDYGLIMKRMHDLVDKDRASMEKGAKRAWGKGFDLYNSVGTFVGDKTISVDGRTITAPRILIASGAREGIPKIEGLEHAGYITSTSALELKKAPKSLVIIGGGYIACEFGHFFSAMGTKVTIIGRNPRLLPEEEPEISEVLRSRLSAVMDVHTDSEVIRAGRRLMRKSVTAIYRSSGKEFTVNADEIMVAAGRVSNSDLLRPEVSGVRMDARGWIIVDGYLRTNVPGIFAIGDALGHHMFRHTANHESEVVWKNMNAKDEAEMEEMDFNAVPHAVFTYPEIASVGMTEERSTKDRLVLVGRSNYDETVKGYAMDERTGFFKVILDARTREILGAHAIGPNATALVQPIAYLMNAGDRTYIPLIKAQTIHPSLQEVITWAFGDLRPGKGQEKAFARHHHHHHHHGHDHDHDHGQAH